MYRKIFVFFFLLNVSVFSHAQVTFVLNRIPDNTPGKGIFITGNFDNWSGGKDYRLATMDDDLFSITLPQFSFPLEFKFTAGNWGLVETNENGEDIENRSYSFKKEKDTVFIEIKGWKQERKEISSTRQENIIVLEEALEMSHPDHRTRKIWAYLPPDYHNSSKSYPVIYMHDGQNLFDHKTSFSGEWEVDETLNNLFEELGFSVIIIGIENGGNLRIEEYTPWQNENYGGGGGKKYIDFIVQNLKPEVDKRLRTLPDAKNTAIMGSSLGGLISYYGGLEYPETFGKIGVFSPSFWFADDVYEFTSKKGKSKDQKIYFLAGYAEDDKGKTVQDAKKISQTLIDSGYSKYNLKEKYVQDGKHNEQFWRSEFGEAILWLFKN